MVNPLSRKSVRTSVVLPEEAYSQLLGLAESNDVSVAWLIRTAVLHFLEEHGNETQLPLRLPKINRHL